MSNMEYHDTFLDGNERIEAAIEQYYKDSGEESLDVILSVIRERMHADGHWIFPVAQDEEDPNRVEFLQLHARDGKAWTAAFTSDAEYEKGAKAQVYSYFIDSAMKLCLQSQTEGFVINPWGQSFLLTKEMIERIFAADEGVEYTVPDVPITEELLEDGSFLKRAVDICSRNRTSMNVLKLARILKKSTVWIPCTAIMSDTDQAKWEKLVLEAQEKGDLDSLTGQVVVNQDEVRLVPDILQSGNDNYFPVFTSEEEMGEYGTHFSRVPALFLEAANLAVHNERDLVGIVINPFTQSFVINKEIFDTIAEIDSGLETDQGETKDTLV